MDCVHYYYLEISCLQDNTHRDRHITHATVTTLRFLSPSTRNTKKIGVKRRSKRYQVQAHHGVCLF